MRIKILIIFIISLLFLAGGLKPVFALEHIQKNGLFSIDVPEGWRWFENSGEIVITYPDGKTVAIDIQLAPGLKISQADIKKNMKESNDKIIDDIKLHKGTLMGDKELKFDGVYATQLDFKTSPPNPVYVTYISFFNKGYAFSIRYGSMDDKLHSVMDDVVASFKFR